MIIECPQAGEGVHLLASAEDQITRDGKDTVKPGVEHVGSYFRDKPLYVVRDIEGVLPGISLLETTPHLHRIEVIDKTAIGPLRANEVA